MKQIKLLLLIVMSVVFLMACGGGGDDPIIPEPQPEKPETPTTSTQTVTFMANEQLQQTVTLTGLKAAIADFDNQNSWVTNVIPLGYGGTGAPNVSITISENKSNDSRSGVVTFKDTKQNTVILTISQSGVSTPSGIEDPHDTQSDQPAYGRQH